MRGRTERLVEREEVILSILRLELRLSWGLKATESKIAEIAPNARDANLLKSFIMKSSSMGHLMKTIRRSRFAQTATEEKMLFLYNARFINAKFKESLETDYRKDSIRIGKKTSDIKRLITQRINTHKKEKSLEITEIIEREQKFIELFAITLKILDLSTSITQQINVIMNSPERIDLFNSLLKKSKSSRSFWSNLMKNGLGKAAPAAILTEIYQRYQTLGILTRKSKHTYKSTAETFDIPPRNLKMIIYDRIKAAASSTRTLPRDRPPNQAMQP